MPNIVLSGETNAGKSSLFNLLLKHNRSIVSSTPGTTRDYISESITIDSVNFRLVDTAGIRESSDNIENEGIDRSFHILNTAFFKILVIDPHVYNINYLLRFEEVEFDLILLSHSDSEFFALKLKDLDLSFLSYKAIFAISNTTGSIGPVTNFGPIEPVTKSGPIEPVTKSGPIEPVTNFGPIEPVTNFGPIEPVIKFGPIEPVLKKLILNKFLILASQNPILIERHRTSIHKIYSKFTEVEDCLESIQDIAIISSEINTLGMYLTELVGIVSPDDILNSIFSNFCIGK
jgi:tRNA modification GTPase